MIVKALRYLGDPHPLIVKDIAVVIVEADNEAPIMVGCQYGPPGDFDAVTVSHVEDEDFHTILRNLGFTQLTVCHNIRGALRHSVADLEAMPRIGKG